MLGEQCFADNVAFVDDARDLLINHSVSLLREILLVAVLCTVVDGAERWTQTIFCNHTCGNLRDLL